MKSIDGSPVISVVIPTLNSERTLKECLRSICSQDYPAEKIEIIIADGGSTDSTRDIVRLVQSDSAVRMAVVPNALKTGEAGKAAGLKSAKGELVAFIDSDNILPDKGWLKRMVEPFADSEVAGAEPLEYVCRSNDGYITRYCAFLGMNDPLCLFLGNYDRYSALTGKWTGMPYFAEDMGPWFKLKLDPRRFPTMGANGFIIRREALGWCQPGDYLFDIDIICELLLTRPGMRFAKVKTGIIHVFSGDIRTFIRKQKRRLRDYRHYNRLGLRKYPWKSVDKAGVLKFVLSCVTVVPLLSQSARGYMRRPNSAWLFHPVACWLTLIVYGFGTLTGFLGGELKREGWSQ